MVNEDVKTETQLLRSYILFWDQIICDQSLCEF